MEQKTPFYQIVYDNDTGPDDDSFTQSWDVFEDDAVVCRCYSKVNAERIVSVLQRQEFLNRGN